MRTPEKIAILGAALTGQSGARIDCFSWDKPDEIANLSDYDCLVVFLPSLASLSGAVDWQALRKKLHVLVSYDILTSRGSIVVIGNPAFEIKTSPPLGSRGDRIEEQFLSWTGFEFVWDSRGGDSMRRNDKYPEALPYLRSVKEWSCCLRHCAIGDRLAELWNIKEMKRQGRDLELRLRPFCSNRYREAVAFALVPTITKGYFEKARLGPFILLPQSELPEDQAVRVVLRDLCGLRMGLEEPPWIRGLEVPGQEAVEDQLLQLDREIDGLQEKKRQQEENLAVLRSPLRLLYDRGHTLEAEVRSALAELGGDVEDPTDPGKEDGWVSVTVGGTKLEFVLEVKSTEKQQFRAQGLRQLSEWQNRGIVLRGVKYKPLFIGNSQIGDEPEKRGDPFSDDWVRTATLMAAAAIRAEDLYTALLRHREGALDPSEFWRCLHEVAGPVHGQPWQADLPAGSPRIELPPE